MRLARRDEYDAHPHEASEGEELALPEVEGPGRRVGYTEAERDQTVDRPKRKAAD